MDVDLDLDDIEVIIQSLSYSIAGVTGETETVPEVRRENVDRLERARAKLIRAKEDATGSS